MSTSALHNMSTKKRFRPEEFWLDDITELYKNNNYVRFFPKYKSTRIEQMNAITRFSFYLILLILLFSSNYEWLYLPITLMVLIVFLHNINKTDKFGNAKELDKILGMRDKDKKIDCIKKDIEYLQDGDDPIELETDFFPDNHGLRNTNLESGSYTSDSELNVGPYYGPPSEFCRDKRSGHSGIQSLFTVDEIDEFEKNICRKPSEGNPFMNLTISDYNNGDPPVACNASDDEIKNEMKVNFNKDLFRDVDELWDKHNSQRQFYTMPNTAVPNNQKEFAEWVYKVPYDYTCKESGKNCFRQQRLRQRRFTAKLP